MLGSKKSLSVPGGTTLISSDTVVVGEIRFRGNLDVEGLVQGNIIADAGEDALLRIVGKGRVEGEIRVPSVVINGEVEGNVYATRHLELAPKSCVHGNVYYHTVEMAAGAEVNGSLSHLTDEEFDCQSPKGQTGGDSGAGEPRETAPDAKVDQNSRT